MKKPLQNKLNLFCNNMIKMVDNYHKVKEVFHKLMQKEILYQEKEEKEWLISNFNSSKENLHSFLFKLEINFSKSMKKVINKQKEFITIQPYLIN